MISEAKLERLKEAIFAYSRRLIERQLYRYVFENAAHHLVFGRYWSPFAGLVNQEFIESEAERFARSIGESGLIEGVFPGLPWWDPIVTFDGMVSMKRYGLLPERVDHSE